MEEIIEWYKGLSNKIKFAIKASCFIIVIGIITVIFMKFFYAPMVISGNSMNPSLEDKDIVIIDKRAYKDKNPERFDLIAFKYRYDYSQKYIKRVIALPGESVYISNNVIYIKGVGENEYSEFKEFYGIYEGNAMFTECNPVTLEEDEYFVLGDNRYDSDDSRNSVGLVKKNTIIGKAVFRLFPFKGIGSLKYQ